MMGQFIVVDATVTGIEDDDFIQLPQTTELLYNYPNPFNPQTTLVYSVAERGRIRVDIYNIPGEQLDVLVDDMVSAGRYETVWEANDMPGGVYFVKLHSATNQMAMKILLMR